MRTINKQIFTLIVICITTVASYTFTSKENTKCPKGEDYSPCTCDLDNYNDTVVHCVRIGLSEIRSIFSRTSPADLTRVDLTPPPAEVLMGIPANVLGNNKRVTHKMSISCPTRDYKLHVHPEAFDYAAVLTKEFAIGYCDLSSLTWTFLAGFERLDTLWILSSNNVHRIQWTTLPVLPFLSALKIRDSQGLNEWISFPHLANGLKEVYLGSNGLDDRGINRILNWLLKSSEETVKSLSLDGNGLTSLPAQIPFFARLEDLDVSYNKISFIPTGSLNFSVAVSRLDLSLCPITRIEPGAFQGDFRSAVVSLRYLSLSRFERSVFMNLLQQMTQSSGHLDIPGGKFDCRNDLCHLSWIIRDHRDLLKPLNDHGFCANGTSFLNLDPKGFKHCSGATRLKDNTLTLIIIHSLMIIITLRFLE